jgi:hypothetical protein
MVVERATLEVQARKGFQAANRRNKFYLSIKGVLISISSLLKSLKSLLGEESTHLNVILKVSAIFQIASISCSQATDRKHFGWNYLIFKVLGFSAQSYSQLKGFVKQTSDEALGQLVP